MIKLSNITKSYKAGENVIYALKNINHEIKKGELVAIMGPSGAGKSTLMNIIGLLDIATSGDYYLSSKKISGFSDDKLAAIRNQIIGFIFQSFCLLPMFTALQNVGMPLVYREIKTSQRNKMALSLLSKLDIADLANRKPDEMSGGQQQRIAIARALVGNPEVILADEPTGALDTKTGKQIMELLVNLNERENKTIIIVTHDPHICSLCHRIIYVKDGEIVQSLDE